MDGPANTNLTDRAVAAARIGLGVDVLDLGSPGGAAAIAAARHGACVVGVQPGDEAIAAARRAAEDQGVTVDWHLEVPGEPPCPPECMDAVLALGVPPDPGTVMLALRPGGRFVAAGDARDRYAPWGVTFEAADGLTVGRRWRRDPADIG